MSERLYTVKDVAAIIAPEPSMRERVLRQVRHWTATDVLKPLGGKATGTGVSRVYKADDVRKAALVLEIVRYGVPLDVLESFSEWCDGLIKDGTWEDAIEGRRDVFMAIMLEHGDDPGVIWGVERGVAKLPLISLSKTWKQEELRIAEPASAIAVNLSKVFKRLNL